MKNLPPVATLAIASGMISIACLLALHVTSREFQPSWRMVSEYALGKNKKILTLFFVFWCICSLLSACVLWHEVTSPWAKVGVVLVGVSGIGALMGGLFDVKHKLHGVSFMLGIPPLPVAALLISYHLVEKEGWNAHALSVLLSAHLVWISLVLMGISMMLLFSGFKKAGLPMGPDVPPPDQLPEGVVGVSGYANRFLIFCYIGWLVWMAKTYVSIHG